MSLVFIKHGTHRMHPGGVTAHPAGKRTVQRQARHLALGLDERLEEITFLIRDRGPNFTRSLDAVFQATGARILHSAVQAPRRTRPASASPARYAVSSWTACWFSASDICAPSSSPQAELLPWSATSSGSSAEVVA